MQCGSRLTEKYKRINKNEGDANFTSKVMVSLSKVGV